MDAPRIRIVGLLVAALGLAALGLAAGPAQAQQGTVTGTVVEADGEESLPSVNVGLAGTSLGAATDERGRFTISDVPVCDCEIIWGTTSLASERVNMLTNTIEHSPCLVLLDRWPNRFSYHSRRSNAKS